MSNSTRKSLNSTWTPLGNPEFNAKVFDERKNMVGLWFDKWNDTQRKAVLQDLVSRCKLKQIEFAGDIVSKKRPVYHEDFTRVLPRVLSIYVFSYLDPRSLSRCSQVCWAWKTISELDQLWMKKCMRLGWVLTFSPSPYEVGVWKRLYIENIVAMKCITPKMSANLSQTMQGLDITTARTEDGALSSRWGTPRKGKDERPPWKGSDPVPKDTWRNNYLDNDCEMEKVDKLRKKAAYGKETQVLLKTAKNKVNTGNAKKRPPSALPRSASADLRRSMPARPDWAQPSEVDFQQTIQTSHINPQSAVREEDKPKKTTPTNKLKTVKVMTARSDRDPPTSRLFPEQPWKVPDENDYDSDTY